MFAEKIREYIEEFVLYGDPLESDDTSLIASGMIDSTGAMEMVMFIEDTFHVSIPNPEIKPDNLDTVNRIVAMMNRLSGTKSVNVA